MIRVAPRFLITVLAISAATAFGAAAHGPIAPKPDPEISAPAILKELGRRVGVGPRCGCEDEPAAACGESTLDSERPSCDAD